VSDSAGRQRVRSRVVAMAAALVAGALVASGCGLGRHGVASPPATTGSDGAVHVPTGSSTQTIEVGGRSRTFRVFRPSTLPDGEVPLVVMLHGGFGDDDQAETAYGWDDEASREGFVVAYPNGLNRAWDGGGGCCGKPGAEHVDDVGFISQVVVTVERELSIDARRVYATGISNGGIMSYRLACDTTIFAAIGPDSATLMGSCDHPAPVSVIHIHGTADHNIPFAGGQGSGFAKVDGPPVPEVVASWRSVDGCSPPVSSTAGVVTRSVASCPDGRTVELITIAGAGHQWPGSQGHGLIGRLLGLDPPSHALDATSTIWAFFAAHPKP